jgi:hypothetical protein
MRVEVHMNNLYRAIQDTAGWWVNGPSGFLCPVPDQAQAEDLACKMNQVIKEALDEDASLCL